MTINRFTGKENTFFSTPIKYGTVIGLGVGFFRGISHSVTCPFPPPHRPGTYSKPMLIGSICGLFVGAFISTSCYKIGSNQNTDKLGLSKNTNK